MFRHLKLIASLCLCTIVSIALNAKDLYADYAEETPITVLPAQMDEPALQQWQSRFADACALTMSDKKEKHSEAVKILFSLLDERPDATEVLNLLYLIAENKTVDADLIHNNVIRLAEKYPSARDLNLFALGCFTKKIPGEKQEVLLKNALEVLSKDPLTGKGKEERWAKRNMFFGFLLASVFAVEQNKSEFANVLTRCRTANPFHKKELTELRAALPILSLLTNRPFFPISQAKQDVLAFYAEMQNAFQDFILNDGLENLPPGEEATMASCFDLCVKMATEGQAEQLILGLEDTLKKKPDQALKTELLLQLYRSLKQGDKALTLANNYFAKVKKPDFKLYALVLKIHCDFKKYDELLTFMDRHLAPLPERLQTAFRLEVLKVFFDQKDDLRAAAVLKTMKTFQSLSGRVQLLVRAQRPEEAYRELKEKAVPRFLAGERSINAKQDQAFLEVAMLLCDQYQDFDTMDKIFTVWLKDHPDDHLVLNNLAFHYAEANVKLDQALKMVTAALKIEPDNAAYIDTMAWVLYRQKKYQEAAKWIEKAVAAFGGENSELLDHAGDIYFALGKKDKAVQYWQRALKALEDLRSNLKSEKLDNEIKAIRKKLDALKNKVEK